MVELNDMAATEALNPATANADAMGTLDFLTAMNAEDHKVPQAVGRVLPQIAAAVDLAVAALKGGGRLIYVGAGTSGRLGVLDASECPPTFGTAPETVVGVIAGGDKALTQAVEGAEDSAALAEEQLGALNLGPGDVVVGLAASGRTPFVVGALAYARGVGAATVSVACNPSAAISRYGDVAIEVDNGPEVLTGSTRLKAGTSQKLILNMISTATMVRLGKVYRNLMVDVGPTNEKLIARAEKIVQEATGCDLAAARDALSRTNYHAKTAIVMLIADVDAATAAERLAAADGFVRGAIAAA